MINVLIFILYLVSSSINYGVDGLTLEEDLELERELKLLNKHPVKSIHTKYGHIVDCIDINKQPAFDHPLLKNHKLQREPSFQTSNENINLRNSSAKPLFGLEKDECPTGTVPIQRITKDDLIRTKSFSINHVMAQQTPYTYVSEVTVLPKFGPYYGVSGNIGIYKPQVAKNQMSTAHLWVQNGPYGSANRIAAGWHVAPVLYGDDRPYFFIAWTSDDFTKTGCYNLRCRGYVQVAKENYPGTPFDQIPDPGFRKVEFGLSISQDPVTKNWWLSYMNVTIGYFPAALFSNLASASKLGWGGRSTTLSGNVSPPMGSGRFPDDTFLNAAYFRSMLLHGASRKDYGPPRYLTDILNDRPKCFFVVYYADKHEKDIGYSLEYGGPGGIC